MDFARLIVFAAEPAAASGGDDTRTALLIALCTLVGAGLTAWATNAGNKRKNKNDAEGAFRTDLMAQNARLQARADEADDKLDAREAQLIDWGYTNGVPATMKVPSIADVWPPKN